MVYPASLDDLTTAVPTGGSTDHEEHTLAVATAVEALQAKVGVGDSTPDEGWLLVGTASGDSEWQDASYYVTDTIDSVYGGALRKATVTLSSADILDLHNTPVTLVAAPGAGKWLVPVQFVAYFTAGASEYLSGGSVVAAWYWGTERRADIADLSGTTSAVAVTAVTATGNASDVVNKAILIGAVDALTLGDGTLTVTVWYTVEDVPA